MRLKNVAHHGAFVGILLFAASVFVRFWALDQTPFATGWDSYFYLIQVKSIEETGRMHSPEASLIYPYLRFFYGLSGDYVRGMKLATAFLCGVFTLLLYGRKRPNLLLAAWSIFSPQLTFFAAQYPKNLLGLVLFVGLLRSLEHVGPRDKKSWAWPVFLLALGYFGHRLMFGLALVYMVCWLGFRFKSQLFRKSLLRPLLFWTGGGLVLFLLGSLVFPGLAHLADLGRLRGTLSGQAQFAPWSFVQSFGLERISSWWLFEIGAVTLAWTVGCGLQWRKTTSRYVSNPALLWFCGSMLFPFLEWSLTGLAWRMFLVFVLLVPLAFDWNALPLKASRVFVIALLAASVFSWKAYVPALHDPDYGLYQQVTRRAMAHFSEGTLEQPELCIAHNALAEYFTFSTGIDAMPWLPEYPIDSNRLCRIAAGVNEQALRYFSGPENALRIKPLGGGYFLLPAYVWQQAVKNARAEDDTYFLQGAESWLNPNRQRPPYLLLRKQGKPH